MNLAVRPIAQSEVSSPPEVALAPIRSEPLTRGRGALRDFIVVGVACILFLAISLYHLDLPGLYTDEAYDVIPAMQMVLGHHVELQGNVLDLDGLRLPLMSSSAYQGVTYTYLALPFFALGGINIFSLRLMTVLVGALGVVLAYFLGRSWFGREVGCLTAMLLALSPAWIFWSRLGVYVVSVVAPIAMGALLAFTYWLRARPSQNFRRLYLGLFLLGLGLTTKLLFLWFISAVVLTAIPLYYHRFVKGGALWAMPLKTKMRAALFGLLSFCLGALPFILYNILTRGTFNLIRQTVAGTGTTSHGVDNLAIVRNLWTEVDAFKVMLDGGYFWFQGVGQQPHANPFPPAVFALSALGLLAMFVFTKRQKDEPQNSLKRYLWADYSLGAALILSIMLAFTSVSSLSGTFLMVITLLLTLGGASSLVWGTLRKHLSIQDTGRALLGTMALSGALWWFSGGGRPDTRAPGAFLGLWPIDAAGILFWVTGAALMIILGADKKPIRFQRPTVAALSIIGLLVAQSTVTVSGLWSTHLLLALPLPQMVIAGFAVAGTRDLSSWLAAKRERMLLSWTRFAPAVLLLGVVLFGDVAVDGLYHHDLALTGGASTFSDAIYSLNNYLLTDKAGYRVVAMDWGFRRPLQFLSQERTVPIEGFGLTVEPPPEFYASLRKFLADSRTVYLFHTEQGTAYHRRDAFLSEIAAAGKVATLDITFKHRDGSPVYDIYTVK